MLTKFQNRSNHAVFSSYSLGFESPLEHQKYQFAFWVDWYFSWCSRGVEVYAPEG